LESQLKEEVNKLLDLAETADEEWFLLDYTDFNNPCRKRQAYFIPISSAQVGIILIPLK